MKSYSGNAPTGEGNDLTAAGNEVDRLVNLGRQLSGVHLIRDDGRTARALVVPEGCKVENLQRFCPELPDRIYASVFLSDVESFIAYVNEHRTDDTRIFATITAKDSFFEAAIDYHAAHGDPSWVTHLVRLDLTKTPEWETWEGKDGQEFSQASFAEFLEDNQVDIVEPDGATMLEIAKSLEATEGVAFQSKVRLSDGSMAFSYTADVNAHTGADGQLRIPETFRLRLAPFVGMPAVAVEARFRFRLRRPTLVLYYQIVRRRQLVESMVQAAGDMIKAETGVTIFRGRFEERK